MKDEFPTMHMHWMTKTGVGFVVAFALAVAALNVIGWWQTMPGAAGAVAGFFAFCLEGLAFVLWEHVRAHTKAHRWLLVAGSLFFLAAAVGVNVYGGHQGLNYLAQPLHERAERERLVSQNALDESRRGLETQIAEHQNRIDAVPLDLSGGPQNDAQAQAAWNLLTADDRQQRETLRNRLDGMPLVVAQREPYPEWGPFAIAAFFVLVSVFGLSVFGVKVPGSELTFETKRRPPVSQRGGNVIDFGTARDTRDADKRDADTVRRLQAAGYSLRRIQAETGISKSRAGRLAKVQ